MDRFTSYAQLAVAFDEGRDFVLHVRRGDEDVAVIAPHGGLIEPGTLEIADEIAGAVFDFYAFEAKIENAFQRMHITSTLFDEPRCLDLISTCRRVLAVHGVAESTHRLLVGGLDSGLRDSIVAALVQNGFAAEAVSVGRLSATGSHQCLQPRQKRCGRAG